MSTRAENWRLAAAGALGLVVLVVAAGCAGPRQTSSRDTAPPKPSAAPVKAEPAAVEPPPSPVYRAPPPSDAPATPVARAEAPAVSAAPSVPAAVDRGDTGRKEAAAPPELKSQPPAPAKAPPAADKPAPAPAKAPPPADKPAPAPVANPAPAPKAAPAAGATATLDLAALEKRLKDTGAIGVFTKLTLKNQVDELLGRFRAYYEGRVQTNLAQLRQPYDLLILKVLSLLQDGDPSLARAIAESREAIWGILSDPNKFKSL